MKSKKRPAKIMGVGVGLIGQASWRTGKRSKAINLGEGPLAGL